MKVVTINISDEDYPQDLKNVYQPPENLYCLGNMELLKEKKKTAVVGSREMSGYGKSVIEYLVPELIKREVVIVSGMAFGVDAWAHKVCVDNNGKTIAVLASGVDVISPKGNENIYQMILNNGGLIVSENKCGYKPKPVDFIRRNRITAGIADSILVIEGGEKSGSVNTARLGLEIGKDVGAIPGRIFDENSKATNWLLKNGAVMIGSAEDLDDMVCNY